MAREYYQGKFTPRNPEKYAGDVKNIIYRSGWELQIMSKLDLSPSVLLWNSEGLAIPYRSPVDGKMHRYFPDLLVKMKMKDGASKTFLLEIKPHAQTELRTPKRQTRKFLTEVTTFVINQAKWHAAREFCKDQRWEFQIITEKDARFF
jgi:hypothetical protein